MSKHFKKSFDKVIIAEGGYSDDPMDSGGKTKYGITQKVANRFGYRGDMKDLSLETAENIYKANYWDVMQLDSVAKVSAKIAHEMFDTGVNTGNVRAVTFLQQSLNVLNNGQKEYKDLTVDGLMGNNTLKAFRSHMRQRKNDKVLLRMLNCLQGSYYILLATKREKDEKFIYGWFNNRVEVK